MRLPVLPLSSPRAAPPLLCAPSQTVWALDFDGVIVDSEPESTRAAWRAALELWPDIMEEAPSIDPREAGVLRKWTGGSWDEMSKDAGDGMPGWLAAKVRQLRPVVETGYENTLLMRLCVEEALSAKRGAGVTGTRPLSAGEILASWDGDYRDYLLARYKVSAEHMVEHYGGIRDAWMDTDLASWIAANRYYPGAPAAVRDALAAGSTVYIVTTKQQRFAQALLKAAGVVLPNECVFGLGSGPKPDTLAELQARHAGAELAFLEDKVETLVKVARDMRLLPVSLHFAEWGYSTPQQQAIAASLPRVRSHAYSDALGPLMLGTGKEAV